MPNLASRNQSGHLYCFKDSHVGWNGPEQISAAFGADGSAAWRRPAIRRNIKVRTTMHKKLERAIIRSPLGC